jgi:hypothetical protein
MPGENQRETGARAPREKTRPDASDEVSQKAAENKKPRSSVGLMETLSERSESDKSDLVDSATTAKEGSPERNG